MKKTGSCILLSFLMLCFLSIAANASSPVDTALNYFQALQQGDLNTIKDSIAGEIYRTRKVLLEQNERYPEFLRNIYQGANFQIKSVAIQDNNAAVTVEVRFPDRQKVFILFLNKDDLGNWKIFKETSAP